MDTAEDLERKRMPWARFGFDIEGLVGAVAAWLFGIILGILWGPLFWIGAIAAVIVLLATRHGKRTPPPNPDAIVAPVDGVLVSVMPATPPAELRLPGGDYVRLRISSAPSAMNAIHSPLAGEIASIVHEAGEPSVVLATDPELHGLEQSYVTISNPTAQVAMRVAVGAFGPRMEMDVEQGDPVRLGRKIGVRRLGGWCDVWLDGDATLSVWPGMTLKAAETQLVAAAGEGTFVAPAPRRAAEDEAEPFEMPDIAEDTAEASTGDPADMFAKLRKTVRDKSADTDPATGED